MSLLSQVSDDLSLRPFQRDALAGIMASLRRVRSALVVHATGLGKTHLAAAAVALANRPVLFMAPRSSLVVQAAGQFKRLTERSVGIEMAEERDSTLAPSDVVCATVQTMSQDGRLSRYAPDYFGLIICDEAHHSTSDTWRKVLDHFLAARVVGLTATPDRLDGSALGDIFDEVAHAHDIKSGIREGWLAPIMQKRVDVECLDLSTIKVNGKTKDFSDRAIADQLKNEGALHEIASPLIELAGDRPTLVFVPLIVTAQELAGVINGYKPGKALAIDGTANRTEREDAFRAFTGGEVQFLCNAALLTEGIDLPLASCIAIARPTKSRALYCQMIGRGTRISPGKVDCLVIDFVGNSGRHTLMCPANVLDGNTDKEIEEEVRRLTEEDPSKPVHEALEEAEENIAQARRIQDLRVQARYRARDIDPFTIVGASSRKGRYSGQPATDKQLAALLKFGLKDKDIKGLDKGQAGALMDSLIRRSKEGLCTFKQARVLAKAGLKPDVDFATARMAIDILVANNWTPTDALLSDERFSVEA